MRYALLAFIFIAITGCASGDYVQYAKAQENIEVAKTQAQAARYKALGVYGSPDKTHWLSLSTKLL